LSYGENGLIPGNRRRRRISSSDGDKIKKEEKYWIANSIVLETFKNLWFVINATQARDLVEALLQYWIASERDIEYLCTYGIESCAATQHELRFIIRHVL
jgi:putative cell wall-binding protein